MHSGGFTALHPAVQHHVVNSLGWRTLRPLQESAVGPVAAGHHVLLGAPTAGGKTEAAVLPLLSRMLEQDWDGLSVLYVCPLRALLNDLEPRLDTYCGFVGRRAAIWHGDVRPGARRAIEREPPNLLLTTPESIEAMLMSRRVDSSRLLGGVRAVVVDEIHAFAGDDRGWHLLAVLARLDALCGRELQRVGLTATVGNPEWLLDWLVCGGVGERDVVFERGTGSLAAADPAERAAAPGAVDFEVDAVGSLDGAAAVIAALHHGEKRLVFADSRARVEELAAALRKREVTVFVSHSSLGRDERHQAERAFSESRDCVIVATSTLELGIDVGDLDRVIQIGAPRTVAALLQRIGRAGRRPRSRRNCLFLATTENELLQALALVALTRTGWVEPLAAPPHPVNLLAQQLLARVLSEGRVGRSQWPGALEQLVTEARLDSMLPSGVMSAMIARGILVDDGGLVSIGPVGEREYGRRNFLDVTSLFLSEPLVAVRWGQRELGSVDATSLSRPAAKRGEQREPVTILLGGHAWTVREVDWKRRLAWVEPADEPGRSRWSGAGGALSIEVCHAMRDVLVNPASLHDVLTRRAIAQLREIRDEHECVVAGHTALVREDNRERYRWWTFGGGRANRMLAAALDAGGLGTFAVDDLSIGIAASYPPADIGAVLGSLEPPTSVTVPPLAAEAVKFADCLPEGEAQRMLSARLADGDGAVSVLAEPCVFVSR